MWVRTDSWRVSVCPCVCASVGNCDCHCVCGSIAGLQELQQRNVIRSEAERLLDVARAESFRRMPKRRRRRTQRHASAAQSQPWRRRRRQKHDHRSPMGPDWIRTLRRQRGGDHCVFASSFHSKVFFNSKRLLFIENIN